MAHASHRGGSRTKLWKNRRIQNRFQWIAAERYARREEARKIRKLIQILRLEGQVA